MKRTLQSRLKPGTVCLLSLALLLASCSHKVNFQTSSVVPAAEGWAKVKRTESNYSVRIRIQHLAPAERLNPPQEVYTVWVDTEANGIRWLGSMKSSSGFLSKTFKASLDATIPYQPVRVIVTAERVDHPEHPGFYTILQTGSIRVR